MYRLLIDTSVVQFLKDMCEDCNMPFQFVTDEEGSYTTVDLEGLIEFSASVLSGYSNPCRPAGVCGNVIDFRGVLQCPAKYS